MHGEKKHSYPTIIMVVMRAGFHDGRTEYFGTIIDEHSNMLMVAFLCAL